MRVRARAVVVAVLSAALLALAASSSALADEGAAKIHLGTQTLTRCGTAPLTYCGTLSVPLDWKSPESPDIAIAYHWYPATNPQGKATHTVVPVEGGPGYSTLESVEWKSLGQGVGYRPMYGATLEHSNLLAIDNRGTGESAPLNCPALQTFSGPTNSERFQQTAAACAEALNHKYKYADGSWVHASDLFSSTPAARDMAAVIKSLELPKIDLYGDSYGSFFAQVFTSHFPRLVRSVVLDSTYETANLDPAYRSTLASMPAAFQAACERYVACAQAAPGSVWERIGKLAERLRQGSISGRVAGANGSLEKVTMNEIALVDLVSDAAEDTVIYRELDAAARALLNANDPDPLLRIYAERESSDEGYFHLPVSEYSVELYVADACTDYPQLFNMNASGPGRASELQTALAAFPEGTFSPFSASEWISQNQNTEAFSVCVGWPAPTVAEPPIEPPAEGKSEFPLFPESLPVLVLGGELDTWTPPVDVGKVLAEIGGHARFIELANSTHVVGESDTECGDSLIARFAADPAALDSLDASCAAAVPAIHSVGVYPAALSEQPALEASPGASVSAAQLQLAAAAVSTAGDAVVREGATEVKLDHGLGGGTVAASRHGSLLTLEGDELIPGVKVSGTVRTSAAPVARNGEIAVALLTVKAAGMPTERLTATWTTAGTTARADVEGSVKKLTFTGSMPAP